MKRITLGLVTVNHPAAGKQEFKVAQILYEWLGGIQGQPSDWGVVEKRLSVMGKLRTIMEVKDGETPDPHIDLPPAEYEVLKSAVEGAGKTLSFVDEGLLNVRNSVVNAEDVKPAEAKKPDAVKPEGDDAVGGA